MKTKVSIKGEITLPPKLRQQDGIRAGEQFEIQRLGTGRYLLTKQPEPANKGLVDWLLACPEKGWFQPIRSKSTDALFKGEIPFATRPRRRRKTIRRSAKAAP